jgi:DUF2959 family protein
MLSTRKALLWMAAVGMAAGLTAPAAWAQKAQAKNIEEMGAFRAQIMEIRNQIEPVLNSLNAVVQGASGDPSAAFKSFQKELGKMNDEVEDARKMRADMQKKGQALFAEWEKKMGTITNPQIKAAAEANRTKLQALYDSIEPDIAAVKETGTSFLSDLKDLQAYFQVDLSSAGIASVADMITKANADGKTVQTLLDKVLTTLDQVKTQMAPGGTGATK